MIGIDTSFLIDLLNGRVTLEELTNEQLCITDLVCFEFLLHASKKEEEILRKFTQGIEVISGSFESAQLGSSLWKQLRAKGVEIGKFDCLIAASYLTHGVTRIYTNDTHFTHIPGILCVAYPINRKKLNSLL